MYKDKLRLLAEKKIVGLMSAEIDFVNEGWENVIAYTPKDLRDIFKNYCDNQEEFFAEKLEEENKRHSLKWEHHRLLAFANGSLEPTLKELNDFAYTQFDGAGSGVEPDYLLYVPLLGADGEAGFAVITADTYPEYDFRLKGLFKNIEDARDFVKTNWFLDNV